MTDDIHTLAKKHLPGDYTVTRREFTDCSTRTIATHAVGPGAGEYTEFKLWMDFSEIWVSSIENDRVIHRSIWTYELTGRVI